MSEKSPKSTKSEKQPEPSADGFWPNGEGFNPCQVWFTESVRFDGSGFAQLHPERDHATYNPATGVIRARLRGSLPIELSIRHPSGPTVVPKA